ncbi:MAG: HEAT repeat domain-containing protein [Promethearchaeota archaeon]
MSENIKKLIKNLKSKNETERKQSVFKLGEIKNRDAVKGLIRLLKKEKNDVIKRNATRALGKIRDNSAVQKLCDLLYDKDYYVRQNAAWALGKIGDNRAVEPLLRLIKGGGAKVFSISGSESKINGNKKVNTTLKEEGMRYHDVQIKAIKALGEIGNKIAVDPLISELEDEENGQIRCQILLALGKIGDEKAIPTLIEMLSDDIWYVRRDAAKALIKFAEVGKSKLLIATDLLIEKLSDKYIEVAEYSAKAIEKIGKLAVAKAFLIKPAKEIVKSMVKKIFQSKQGLIDTLMQLVDLEKDPARKQDLKMKISKLGKN